MMERLRRISGVSWEWKDPERFGDRRQIGVIAQDVQAVFPELVIPHPDGHLTVDYHGLVAPVIEAVKELDRRLAEIERRLDAEGR